MKTGQGRHESHWQPHCSWAVMNTRHTIPGKCVSCRQRDRVLTTNHQTLARTRAGRPPVFTQVETELAVPYPGTASLYEALLNELDS